MTTVFSTPFELKDKVGTELGKSDWLTIDQDRINLFAEVKGAIQSTVRVIIEIEGGRAASLCD